MKSRACRSATRRFWRRHQFDQHLSGSCVGCAKRQLSVVLCCLLSGCSSMSGYDAKTAFACKAPDGVLCQSMTGVYANVAAKTLPGQRQSGSVAADGAGGQQAPRSSVLTAPISSGTPIRSNASVVRIWLAPWKDSDGDLHDQSYIYLTLDYGDWLLEHNQRRIIDAYRPVHAAGRVDKTGAIQQPKAAASLDQESPEQIPDRMPILPATGSTGEAESKAVREMPSLPSLPRASSKKSSD